METDWIKFFAEKAMTLPDDMKLDDAIQALSDLLGAANNLTDEQRSTIAAVGALAYRSGLEHFKAGNQAAMYLDKFRK